jgi:hypothetical protein
LLVCVLRRVKKEEGRRKMNVLFPSFLKQQSLHTAQEVDFGADGKRGDRECDTEH